MTSLPGTVTFIKATHKTYSLKISRQMQCIFKKGDFHSTSREAEATGSNAT